LEKLKLGLLVVALCLVCAVVSADENVAVGLSYSDMDDFDEDWGVRVQWWPQDNWLVSGGWNNVDTMVTSEGGPMRVNGQLWQLDLSYILNAGNLYYGLGAGVRNIDADWTLSTITTSARKIKPQGHAVIGLRMGNAFVDVRYEVGDDMFGYDADGVQGTVGVNFDIPPISFGDKDAPLPTRSMYWEPAGAQASSVKSAAAAAGACPTCPCGSAGSSRAVWDRFYFPQQFP
jgi:hypothetical protein